MSKKILAVFLVLIFVLGIALIALPAQAHFTLGRPTDTVPYRVADFDPHVPGPTGYVWPGAGVVTLDSGAGAPSPVTWAQMGYMSPPGYQSPFTTNPPGAPTSWLQLAGNAYAPFGAILTSTDEWDNKGDLIFAINFTTMMAEDGWPEEGVDYRYSSLTIYIPPEFGPPVDWASWDTSNIVTTITNERGAIACWQADVKDPFGPNWWVIYIHPGWWYAGGQADNFWTYPPRDILFSAANDYNEWYYVRVNGMSAPMIAGKYQFKMFLDESYPIMNTVLPDGELDEEGIEGFTYPSTMPVENWPVLLVKGEVDPGIIEGTVRYGAWNQDLYNLPIQLPGRVRAVGVANDPYTGESTGRNVEARGYFNASAKGHYEIEGVAPGVYDIYASAAGYPEMLVAEGLVIGPGKSLHLDILLEPGPIITGVVYSKHSFGEVAFPSKRPITIELYDSNEWPVAKPGYVWGAEGLEFERGTGEVWTDQGYQIVDAHLKSFSPINLTDSPFTSYVIGNTIFEADGGYLADNNEQKEVAFPWEGPIPVPAVSWVGSPESSGVGGKDEYGLFNGVGPAQDWWVEPGTFNFRFQFGIKGFYGAPMEFDGHIPQVFATWLNGMTAGTYYLRAWINGYVQTDVSGNYVDYPFTVTAEEWAGDINTPMDLETSSWINKTVHFHNLPGTLDTSPIQGPDENRYLIAEVVDADGMAVGMNFTKVWADQENAAIQINGFGMAGPDFPDEDGMKFFLYRYRHIRDYGMMPGSYMIKVYMRGYVQQEFEWASISLSQSPAWISNHMYRGAGINMTVYSIDWEHPRIDRPWTFPNDIIKIFVYDEDGNSVGKVKYYGEAGGWNYPQQDAAAASIPYNGWKAAWDAVSYLKFNGSTDVDAWGPDTEGFLDGRYLWDYSLSQPDYGLDGTEGKFDAQTGIWLEFGYDVLGFLAGYWRYHDGPDAMHPGDTVLALETGVYTIKGFTLGYVQKKDIEVYAQKGSQADTKLNLVQGVNITVNIKFKKEGIFTEIPYNTSFKIRVFDDNDNLAATWFSSLYDSSIYAGVQHDGKLAHAGYMSGAYELPYDDGPEGLQEFDWDKPSDPVYGSANYVRAGTNELQVLIVGNHFFNEMDWYCACPVGDEWAEAYGIDGWPNYQGGWRIEVEAVNWYFYDKSFPAPPGLLTGEGYYIIEGVEGPYGGMWNYNHLGPWEQSMVINVPNAHLAAEASVVFEMDLRGLVSGNIAGFSWSDELRPTSWAAITASGAAGDFTSYSWDGYYDMYLPAGDYELTVMSSPGHETLSAPITVSTGQLVSGFSFYMERTNVPIPEFPVAVIGLLGALGASMYILRKRRTVG